MINLISIFTRGGAVLWSKEISQMKGNPINDLIQNVILEDRGGEQTMEHGSFTLKWTFANQLELVFVAVYLNLTRLLYVDELLARVKQEFTDLFKGKIVSGQAMTAQNFHSFGAHFDEILHEFQTKYSKKKAQGTKPRQFHRTAKGKEYQKPNDKKNNKSSPQQQQHQSGSSSGKATDGSNGVPHGTSEDSGSGEEDVPAIDGPVTLPPHLKKLGSRRGKRPGGYRPKKSKSKPNKEESAGKKKGKEGRKWKEEITNEQAEAYDMAAKAREKGEIPTVDKNAKDEERRKFFTGENGPSENNFDSPSGDPDYEESSEEDPDWEEEEEEEEKDDEPGGLVGYFTSLKNKVNFNKPLSNEDLEPVIQQVKDDLIRKNVAAEICEKLTASVQASLVGKKLGTFTRIKPVVKQTLEEALLRIVTPKKTVDLLHGVASAHDEGRPYSIVFVGVNGVGKSTSLAKVANYLKSRKFSVSIAACDTFRSGAVEQLQTHARYLGVRLYQKGYSKDPSAVAMDAIKEGKKLKDDVVLIDTAGRMQDNEPLMRALSKLVIQNKPDLILFVGEALVGNDAVDQLTKFNRALSDLSSERVPRLIDGIVLTKFDTVDDKVGAAISMTYTTGSPIIFIGTGQTYADLKRVHAKTIIRMLLR